MKKIIVASLNPVKINSVKNSFKLMFEEEFEVVGSKADSKVSNQPMSSNETLIGAINRLNAIKESCLDSDYWVGMEGGLERDPDTDTFRVMNWVVVCNSNNKSYLSKVRSSDFVLPQKVSDLIKEGIELGDADDVVFGTKNSKQDAGSVGILTNNIITRTTWYEQALILALIPFKNNNLY